MASAATPAAPSLLRRLGEEHARVLVFSLGKLWQKPLGSLLTAAVIGITLALPAGLHVLVRNVSAVSYSWEGAAQISLFLKDSASRQRGEQLGDEIGQRPGVRKALYLSREQSLMEFRQLSGFGEALDLLGDNPLPAVIVVTPQSALNSEQVSELARALAALPEVENAQLDQQWLERLYAILEIIQRGVLLIAGVLGLAVMVTVGNTIRLDIENRREEIVVMKLIGAPDSFIRRPFLYTGLWYGIGGGIIAFVLVHLGLLALAGPAELLASLYESTHALSGLGFSGSLAMFGGGVLLGWVGAFWTVSRHLADIEPV